LSVYYNEIDTYAAAWLRNLIHAGLIPAGDVDERDIRNVRPDDLRGYRQCHFFAGIAGWAYALQLAGWPADREVWTGSCPCQPFSVAGKRKGFEDERHLWPVWRELIAERRPAIVFGEQVASKDGRFWLSGVRSDLEALGYAVGAADLCAAGVSAPHIRQRLYWLAHADFARQNQWTSGRQQSVHEPDLRSRQGLGDAASEPMGQRRQPWEHTETVECEDGVRRVEPGAQPLAYGIPRRLDKIRGYGNAIVPQLAAEFITAFLEAEAIARPPMLEAAE
jgi:DNA (cytosine-5)-methyltransferase 1